MNHMAAIRNDESDSSATSKMLLLGLGNTLLADDGVGVHVVRQLACDPETPKWLQPFDGGTLGFRLLSIISQAEAVLIVDAAELGAPAGTIRLFEREDLIQYVGRSNRSSAHEAGLIDLLTLTKLEGFRPKHLALLGIQPKIVDWGESLSQPVANATVFAKQLAISTGCNWLSVR